jgi:peptidyl-prolyl cis-trans isomerase B (cyclophilin B)
MSKVVLVTSQGRITLSLDEQKAPKTVANFLDYARSGFYDGTIFHRVIPGFVVQGGGMLPGLKAKRGNAAIRNEADNGLKNRRGSIAMARTGDPHSASSQFFINLRDNAALDFKSANAANWGYCVFGEVTEGMDIVDAIAKAKTSTSGMHQDVPVADIVLERAEVADSGG